eukprot:1275861-Ditylum_brightwellii.AAC.1
MFGTSIRMSGYWQANICWLACHGLKKNMDHFYIEQGYLSIKFHLCHIREVSITRQHFMVLLSQ